MILNFFDNVRNVISNLFEKFNFSSILTLLTGVAIGFILCAVTYMLIFLSTFNKKEKEIKSTSVEVDNEEILKLIRSSKNEYSEEFCDSTTGQKIQGVKDISYRLINDIAKTYYPKSSYPIYELSLDELLMLCHYITDRINSMFSGPILKNFKKVKMSQVVKLIDIKKKIDENKVMKAANKMHVPKLASGVFAVLNVFNPVYWVKKLMINTTLVVATNKIALVVIDVVGEETNKVYSKSVFSKEKAIDTDIQKSIEEIENLVESENGE